MSVAIGPRAPARGRTDRPRRLLVRMLGLSLGLHLGLLLLLRPHYIPPMPVAAPIEARLNLLAPADRSPLPAGETAPLTPSPVSPSAPPSPATTSPIPATEPSPAPAPPVAISPPQPETGLAQLTMLVDTHWYTARELDVQPRARQPFAPSYPEAAHQEGREGTVKLLLRIDETGEVQEVSVAEGDPDPAFDAAALEAFRQARFLPAKKNQRPVRALVHVRVEFRLDAEGQP